MSDDTTEAPTSTRDQMATALEQMEGDKPTSDQAPSPEETSATAQEPSSREPTTAPETDEAPDYFGDNFDPSTLSPNEQKAYSQMRKAFTQRTQELAEQRKQVEWMSDLTTDLQSDDPETKQHALSWMAENGLLTEEQVAEAFGFEIEDGDPAEDGEPQSEYEQRLARLEAHEAKKQEEAQAQQLQTEAQEAFAAIEKDAGRELDVSEKNLLVSHALVTAQMTGKAPDFRAAAKELDAAWGARQKGWTSSKETTHIQPGGEAATEVPDLDTPEARRDYMATRLQPWIDQSSR